MMVSVIVRFLWNTLDRCNKKLKKTAGLCVSCYVWQDLNQQSWWVKSILTIFVGNTRKAVTPQSLYSCLHSQKETILGSVWELLLVRGNCARCYMTSSNMIDYRRSANWANLTCWTCRGPHCRTTCEWSVILIRQLRWRTFRVQCLYFFIDRVTREQRH